MSLLSQNKLKTKKLTKTEWLMVALAVSVVLNLLLLVGGSGGDGGKGKGLQGDALTRRSIEAMYLAVPGARRTEIRDQLKSHIDNIRKANREMVAEKQLLGQALLVHDIDKSTLEKRLSKLSEKRNAFYEATDRATVDVMLKLSPEERQITLHRLNRR